MHWKKIIGWIFAGVALLLVLVIVGGYFYLRSNAFHEFAIREIDKQAYQATGAHTQIGGLELSLSKLTAHLYNIVLRGTENPSDPPLLQVDELTVGVKIQSVIHRKLNLDELVIRHPVVNMRVDRQGKNNIPQAPPSQSKSHTSIFDLAIGHFALTDGEVNYNDKKTPLAADLYNLHTDVTFDPSATRYSGTISYDRGQLHYAEYAPLPHRFEAKFNTTPSEFNLESALLKVASSTVSLHANVANFSNPTVAGGYDIRIHAQDFASMSPSVKAAGDVRVDGNIHYQNEPDQPLLRSVAVTGQLASDGLLARSSSGRLDIRRLKGNYQLANGNLRARDIEIDSLGGSITADVDMQHIDATPVSHAHAALHNISLRELQRTAQQAAPQPELKQVAVSGTLNGTADAAWAGTISNLRARSDLTIRADAKNTGNASATNVPVNAAIHAMYDGPNSTVRVWQTSVHLPSTTLSADGEVSDRSSLQIHAQAGDLHQLAALASAFGKTQSAPPAVSGSATVDANVQGSMKKPQLSGQVKAQNLHVEGSDWSDAEFAFSANPSQATVSHGILVSAQRGRASFDANVALHNWSYPPNNPIHAHLNVQQMPIADLEHLANAHYPVSGDLSANVSVNGSQLNPAGSGSANIANARAYDEPIQTLALKFQADNGSITSTLNVATSAGAANTTLTFTPKTKAYKISLSAPSIVLQKFHTVQEKNLPVKGTLSASVDGQGTIDDPHLNAVVQIPQLEMQQKSIGGIKAEVHVANKRANLAFDSQVSEATLHARGQVDLTGEYQTVASLDTSSIPLAAMMATFSGSVPQGFDGQTELHATLKGPLKNKTRLEAHVTIPKLNASYQQLQIGAAGPIHADYVHSVVTLQPAEIRGTGTSLRMQGSVPLAGTSAPNMTAQGSVDLRILRMLQPDIQSSGTVALDVHATGTPKNPSVQGQVRLQNINAITAGAPLGVEKLNGTLDISNDRVRISSMNAQVGGGQVSMGGSVVYRPSLQFSIAMQGKSVRLRYPEGLRTVLDSTLNFGGNMQASTLNGRVLIDSLSFTPAFDIASFATQFSSNAATPAEPGFADTVKLALTVQSKQSLSATSSQVSIEGDVNLNVIGTAANPVITGRTDLTSGELFYRNNRYHLQRGVISFADPNRTNPDLNVSVATTVEQYNLTINMRGTLDKLTTSYVSDPPLATADIIHLIAFGNTTSESAANSSGQSTDAMVASSAIGTGVTSGVQKLAGFSSLQIDPLLGGSNQNPSARIAMQQRVTKNFLFTFSTDVSQPGQELVQGDYQINKHWSVAVTRDQLGGVSIDGRLHTRF